MSQRDALGSVKPSCRRLAVSMLALLLPWAAQATEGKAGDPLAALQEVELKIEQLLISVPTCDGRTPVGDWIQRLAKREEMSAPALRPLADRERLHLADGKPIPIEQHHLELSGRDEYSKIHFLISRLNLLPFLIDLERLQIEAQDGGTVRYSARVGFPCHSELGRDEEPGLELGRPMDSMIAERLDYVRAYHQKLADLTAGSNPARLPEALAAFERLAGSRPLALTALRFGDEGGGVVLEGALVSGRVGFDPASLLGEAGFRDARSEPKADGVCQRFSVAARLAPKAALHSPDDLQEVVLDNGLFDARTAEVCAGAAEPSFGALAARGPALAGKLEKPGLTIHLRNADVTDLVRALHEATDEDFLVASDLRGRVSADFEGAGLDQALAAMAEAGIAVSPGPLRRVSRAAAKGAGALPAAPISGDGGEPIDVTVQRTDTAGFLCSLSNVLERPIAYPRDLAETLTVFASDMPVRRLLEGVAALSGYSVSERGKTLVLGSGAGKAAEVQACAPAPLSTGAAPLAASRLRQRLEATPELNQLAVADLELAGLVQTGEGWQAYVCAPPLRRLIRLQTETELRAAKVKEIRSDGVTFAVEGGAPVTLGLRD